MLSFGLTNVFDEALGILVLVNVEPRLAFGFSLSWDFLVSRILGQDSLHLDNQFLLHVFLLEFLSLPYLVIHHLQLSDVSPEFLDFLFLFANLLLESCQLTLLLYYSPMDDGL